MFQNFHDQGYLLALDYTKAFDCLDPNVTKELLLAFGWNIKLVDFIHTIWDRQCRFVCWQNHVHSAPLRGPAQPQGDPLGPMIMSLWILSGFNVIKRNVPINRSSTTLYLDDRTITCSSPEHLRDHWENWVHWSSRVGLIESVNKAVAVAAKPRFHDHLASVFEQDAVQVSGATKVLGAVTVSCPRPLADAESSRVASAVRVVRLLSTIGFTLAPFLRTVGQFALSKASFGRVGRGPTLAASGKLWTACWQFPWITVCAFRGYLPFRLPLGLPSRRCLASVLRACSARVVPQVWYAVCCFARLVTSPGLGPGSALCLVSCCWAVSSGSFSAGHSSVTCWSHRSCSSWPPHWLAWLGLSALVLFVASRTRHFAWPPPCLLSG